MPPQSSLFMENKILLYGASGHCKVIIDILRLNGYRHFSLYDDRPRNDTFFGYPVHHAEQMPDTGHALICIGNNAVRKRISDSSSHTYITAKHPSAMISSDVIVGEGTVIMPGAIVNAGSLIGRHCIVNSGAIVEHDNEINDFAHVSPGAALAGNVTIGEGSHIGINATVIQGVTIGKWATVGAGATVLNDVPDYAVVVGTPAKIIKYNNHG